MFSEGADQNEQATIMVHQIWGDRTKRVTVEFLGQGAQCAVTVRAQNLAGFACNHAASFSAVSASRRPNAMHSIFSASEIGRSLVSPAT